MVLSNVMYHMSLAPRGMCLIFNNCNIEDGTERFNESDHDVRCMAALFLTFFFDCYEYIDKKADEMKELLSKAATSAAYEQAQCLVVIIISHSNQDAILGVDRQPLQLVNDVYAKFNNENCPALQGKPKLFFIQAFQENKDDSGAGTTTDDTEDFMPEPAETSECGKRMATWSDMYIAHAVIPGDITLRNENIGSGFLSTVFTVFSKNAAIMHLEELMEKVQDEMFRKSSHCGKSQTLSVEKYGWTKPLYFNPGTCVIFPESVPDLPE
ncbi:hypothetical protein MTO96_029763 [Rhipicephalus appendiculatus]